ncbi:MAG: glycosyltransferase family 39 protein [Verrucomicrobia bacterium]|nr:glycosyltransferase family 39 protein [Verrucomicrobiota bacterium]
MAPESGTPTNNQPAAAPMFATATAAPARTPSRARLTAPVTQPAQRKSGVRALVGAVALAALLYIGTAPVGDLYDENDTQYAGGAHEMLQDGYWWLPTNNYLPRLQKPPLVYLLTMPSLKLVGHNELGARLPTAFVMCLLVAFVYGIGQRMGSRGRGLLAGMAVATMFGMFIFGKMVMPEPFLTCFITGSLYCVLAGYQDAGRRHWWYLGAWALWALGCLAKGLHGLLFPMAVVGILALICPKSRSALRPLFSLTGLGLFLLIWAPWYVAMEIKFPGFLSFHFVNEQVGHVVGTHYPPDDSPVPLWMFLVQHIVWFFPWSLFIPAALLLARRTAAERASDPLPHRLPVVWMGVVFGSLLFSNRQDYYAMSAWPAFALWVSQLWNRETLERGAVRKLALAGFGLLLLIGFGGVIAAALEQHWLYDPTAPSVIPTAQRDNVWNAVAGFSLSSWRALLPLMWWAFGTMAAGSVVAAWFAWRGRMRAAGVAVALAMVGPLGMAAGGMSVMSEYFSLASIARHIMAANDPQAMVVVESIPQETSIHAASSLFFYLDRPAHWIDVPWKTEFACRAHNLGKDKFLTAADLPPLWQGQRRVFFILEESRADYWAKQFNAPDGKLTPLVKSGTRWLVSNR